MGAKPPIRETTRLRPTSKQLQQLQSLAYSNSRQRATFSSDHEQLVDELEGCEMSFTTANLEDELNLHLSAARSPQELLEMFAQSQLELTDRVQCISVLWAHYQQLSSSEKTELTLQLQQLLLPSLAFHVPSMNIDQLSCCYLYLRKMHVPNSDHTLERILMRALEIIELTVDKELVALPALSRLLVAINLERDFFTPLVCRNFMPHLEEHVTNCQSDQDARLLSTCLFQLHSLIDAELLNRFKQRVLELLQSGTLSSETPKTLLKLLHMLNLSNWSHLNTAIIRQLLLTLRNCVPELESNDLKIVCRTFLHHQEPAALVEPLKQATTALLQQEPTADVLSCAVPFGSLQQRDDYMQQFRQLLQSKSAWQLPNASGHLFSVLRALKIADVRYCDAYWSAVAAELPSCAKDLTHLRFLRDCQRYMNFNNNLGGTYRHQEVERKLSRLCIQAIEQDVAGRLPTKFARLAAFVLGYGQTPFAWKKFPNVLLSKMLAMAPQFDIQDCFLLSRGVQIACELRFRQHVPHLLAMQLDTMDSILIACAERHLSNSEEQPLNASDLSILVRTLSHRKTLKNTQVYNQALAHYKSLNCNDLNSRVVREMAYNFNASHYFVPELLESMFEYVTQQHEHITGDTVEKVLTCAYNLGYTPASLEALDYAALVLIRDFDHMSGLSLVQSCLALCFYKSIPEQLINQVFCVKFIQRIEDEIQICYSKATYPGMVLNRVMQLNRTVCLDLPEANVPWFQQNYVEAQLSKKHFVPSAFNADVKHLLHDLLKDENYFRCNHTTPYGYQIDFVIHFDKDKRPVRTPAVEATMLDRITKVAILLLKLDSFCENDLTALRGPESLKIKHLEMMGYKVLHINEHDWNSKYMNAPGAKANYLKCLLQISH
ncbi:FAST kinase domain-containing protein 1, mitochondrial isoform X2 [Drosophila hydei]|nr:FAST kinase domain-containing protein 1, mitochondrial isoform X2 [Drosophila hydei]